MADRSPQKRFNWATVSRNLVFWLLIVLVPIAFYQMVGAGREQYVEVPYSTFNSQVDAGNVEKVEITSGKFVRGSFRQPVPVEGRKVDHFSVILPIQDSESFIAKLEQK